MKSIRLLAVITFSMIYLSHLYADDRYNFNAGWKLALGSDVDDGSMKTDDSSWQDVTLPYAYNQAEAYSRNCCLLSDTVMWYRKHFVLPRSAKGKRVYVEFEGARFGAHVFINGKDIGRAENGVMAFGFDLTPYILYKGENILSVCVDSDWGYRETTSETRFQWNDKNFYCNYGGINKNVWLHIMPQVHQTLPLYTNLGTVGPYIYAKDISVKDGMATICAETQVVNNSVYPQTVQYQVTVSDKDGKEVAQFRGDRQKIAVGDTVMLMAQHRVSGLHLWSWGYGYLYTVKSTVLFCTDKGKDQGQDTQTIRTGFRKTDFHDGMFFLNDRVLQLKGFAQRSTNEWPALGISLPAWMSDYSNSLVLGCNGNFFRWMHVTPSKQDVESCDRLGLIMAMPAGDAEKDVTDRRWQQRCELERDAIIYNRNNPSIIFYEGGNNNISDEHMAELKSIRDKYDPDGGRVSGCRNMLNSSVAEYGGEMLYVNKSAGKPMFQMEYNRDEGIRRYWDRWSYPYHEEGDGPLYRGSRAVAYNHNQDGLAIENIIRWNEYWLARPGQGTRVNSGGAKIIFSDSNTHARGEKNYRTSGDIDAMRIPKDSYFCHRVMWDGWVDTEKEHTYIIGHWNYGQSENEDCGKYSAVIKPVYVCSTGDDVELFLNDMSLGKGKRSETFLFTWDSVRYEPGTLRAVAYNDGKVVSADEKKTVGDAVRLRMHWIEPNDQSKLKDAKPFRDGCGDVPKRMLADGSDIRIAEIEAVDKDGNRNPLAHDMVHFTLTGNGVYIGGLSGVVSDEEKALNASSKPAGQEGIVAEGGQSKDTNGVGSSDLMLEAGVIRVMVRSTTHPGAITLTAAVKGAKSTISSDPVDISVSTVACPTKDGFYVDADGNAIEADRSEDLPLYLERGETPVTPSFTQHLKGVKIKSIEVPVNMEDAHYLIDDNEATDSKMYGESSLWKSDGLLDNAWVRVTLDHPASVSQISLRMDGFRTTSYPLCVYAITDSSSLLSSSQQAKQGRVLIWQGYTRKCLGDNYLDIKTPVLADTYEIRMVGQADKKDAFASMTELAAKKNVSTKASKSNVLGIIEMEFKE